MACETLIEKKFSDLVAHNIVGQDVIVNDLVSDSRNVSSGALFCAVTGVDSDGHDFIASAINEGAAAVVMERSCDASVPYSIKPDLRSDLSAIASKFYNEPTQDMHVIGVTGTNGKSSVVSFIKQLLSLLGEDCASIGTLGVEMPHAVWATNNTTPGAIELQKLCYKVKQEGVESIALEVSSHALDQYRCEAIDFDTAIFTNLSHDHLDYHQDMETYFKAKQKLFLMDCVKNIIVNQDDDCATEIQSQASLTANVYRYSLKSDCADLSLFSRVVNDGEQQMKWRFGDEVYEVSTSLVGKFNVANLMAAFLAVVAKGFEPYLVAKACSKVVAVAGRMQFIPTERQVLAIVDYAHTPDALKNTLQALLEYKQAKLICVFGCGGDRDKAKRAQMAKVAEQYCDEVIVTADNPRTESVADIAQDICAGFSADKYVVVHDRKAAIAQALEMAKAGDIVLVAGKGHEKYQILGDQIIDFDDAEILAQLLEGNICH